MLLVTLGTQVPSSTSDVTIGVAMLNVLGFSQSLSQFVYNYTDMETSLQAVTRVKDFVDTVKPEDLPHETRELPREWPVHGATEFQNVTVSYDNKHASNKCNDNSKRFISPALDKISFTIPPGHKVGICGRTGSGKSTLLATLFRMVDLSHGRILIDGVDLASLEAVGFWPSPIRDRGGLDADMVSLALSHGQQQIFSLARVPRGPPRSSFWTSRRVT